MSIIIDENLSARLINPLTNITSSVTHVAFEGLASGTDMDIWRFAKENSQAILTKDNDFKAFSSTFGCPPKIIRINCGNKSTSFISKKVLSHKNVISRFLKDDTDCYLEIT